MPSNMTKEVSFPSIIVIRKLEGNVNIEKLLHKRHLLKVRQFFEEIQTLCEYNELKTDQFTT